MSNDSFMSDYYAGRLAGQNGKLPSYEGKPVDSILITRLEYDRLVRFCGNWMRLRWNQYRKQWGYGGVRVWGGNMENLKAQLDYCVNHEELIK